MTILTTMLRATYTVLFVWTGLAAMRIARASALAFLHGITWLGMEELYARSIELDGHHYFIVPFVEDPYVQLD